MGEFTPITTQEDFDTAIGERLKRERETTEKKYEGFLSPETVEEKYKGYLSPDDVKEKYKDYLSPEEAAKKDAQIKRYESSSVKMRIAHETGIPYELAERLSGDDEEAIRKDAESISKLIGKRKAAPLASTEPDVKDSQNAAIKNMLNNLKGE